MPGAQSLTAARVLLVDDDPTCLALLESLFEGDPRFRVSTATDGPEALRISRSEHPDLAIIDVRLPGIDGDAVCDLIKQDPRTAGTRVILVTGRSNREAQATWRIVAADNLVTKPYSPTRMLRTVEAILGIPVGRDL